MPANDVLQATCHEKVFLDKAQFSPLRSRIVWIKNLGNGFTFDFVPNRLHITTLVKNLEVEILARTRFPKTQEIDGGQSIPGNGDIHRHAKQGFGIFPHPFPVAQAIEFLFYFAVELYVNGILRPADFPGIAKFDPLIGMFDLAEVLECLPEQPKLVVDTVTNGRQVQSSQRVQKTGRQASETTISESHIRFFVDQRR